MAIDAHLLHTDAGYGMMVLHSGCYSGYNGEVSFVQHSPKPKIYVKSTMTHGMGRKLVRGSEGLTKSCVRSRVGKISPLLGQKKSDSIKLNEALTP
jgi:hypothetical protein